MISIVCPFYNSEKYLENCVKSVINQTSSDWELILVDDGSTDNGALVIRELIKNDSRIKLFTISNSGPFVARNFGIDKSTSNYITFLDSDDYLSLDTIKILHEKISHNAKIDAIFFNMKVFAENGMSIKEISPFSSDIIIHGTSNIINQSFIQSNFGYGLCGGCFRKEIFTNRHLIKDNKTRYGEDMLLMYYAISKANHIAIITDTLYFYRMNPASTTHTLQPSDYFSRFEVFSQVYNDIDNKGLIKKRDINAHIFWGFFNYITASSKNEKYSLYRKRCSVIRKDSFYRKYLKNFNYSSKKIKILKKIFNCKMYFLIFCLIKIKLF